MNEKLRKLFEARKKAHEDAKRLKDEALARSKADSNDLTEDEETACRAAMAEWHRLDKEISLEQESLAMERTEAKASKNAEDLLRTSASDDLKGTDDGDRDARERLETRAFEMWIVNQVQDSEVKQRYAEESAEVDKGLRALSMDQDIFGGYMVAPQKVATTFLQAVDDELFIKTWSHTEQLNNAHSLGVVSLDTDISDADWNSETGTISFDSSLKFGGRELSPHALDRGIKVSIKLLRNSARPVEALIRERQAYKIAVPLENAANTGNGAGQGLGVFTADSSGISTGRDVSTGNSTTKPTFDNAKRVKYTLKAQYHQNARWLMHRDVALEYALIKDGSGRYMWNESADLKPSTFMGFPVGLSEYAPNTLTTGLYVSILGDFNFMWFAESNQITFTQLNELYRANKQVGFLVEGAFDCMPVLEEAFVRSILA